MGPVLGFPSVWRFAITTSTFWQDHASSAPMLSSPLAAAVGGRPPAPASGLWKTCGRLRARHRCPGLLPGDVGSLGTAHPAVRRGSPFGKWRGFGRAAWPRRRGRRGVFPELQPPRFPRGVVPARQQVPSACGQVAVVGHCGRGGRQCPPPQTDPHVTNQRRRVKWGGASR